ncbi:hypothetical protein A2U01_0020437, partial [Trifolium medium]|nr:hypothetical protein [Trifolium medium]
TLLCAPMDPRWFTPNSEYPCDCTDQPTVPGLNVPGF